MRAQPTTHKQTQICFWQTFLHWSPRGCNGCSMQCRLGCTLIVQIERVACFLTYLDYFKESWMRLRLVEWNNFYNPPSIRAPSLLCEWSATDDVWRTLSLFDGSAAAIKCSFKRNRLGQMEMRFWQLPHSHVGDVLHLRLALQHGERADPSLRVHAGDPGAAAGASRGACLRGHPRVPRAHRHPDRHDPPPEALPRARGSPHRGESPDPWSRSAHLGCPNSQLQGSPKSPTARPGLAGISPGSASQGEERGRKVRGNKQNPMLRWQEAVKRR